MTEPERQARDPSTAQQRLEALAKDPALQSLVAQNPNTPTRTLLALAASYPREVSHNPAFELALLETPQLIASMNNEALFALASCEDTPDWLIEILAMQPKSELKLLLSYRQRLSLKTLWQLTNSLDCVHNILAHPNCTDDLWVHLAEQEHSKLFIAREPRLPERARAVLERDTDPQVKLALRLRSQAPTSGRSPTLRFESKCDVGKRSYNEDALGSSQNDSFAIFIVADGMGGNAGGDIPANALRDSIVNAAKQQGDTPLNHQQLLHNSFLQSHLAIQQATKTRGYPTQSVGGHILSLYGLGATSVVLLLQNDTATIAHIGDCRAYLFRDETLSQLTEDHRLLNEFKKYNMEPTEEQRRQYKNIVTRVAGIGYANSTPDLTQLQIQPKDVFLLCSDGLTDMIDDSLIEAIMQRERTLSQRCDQLLDAANNAGGDDNITFMLIEITE